MGEAMAEHNNQRDATKNVHAGTNHVGDSVNTPIFLSSTYKLTEERYAGWAAGAQHTLLYSRLSSVNSDAVAQKICAMEGGEDAETFASGMAAISTTMLMLLNQGDHVVASADVYGGTYGLMTEELPRLGIETTMADIQDPSSYEAAIKENTKILYIETITNPNLKVCDIPAMVEVGKRHNLLVIVDNTFASPWACQPLSMGVDLVIHSTTKFLGGHSDLIGGAVVGSKELIAKIFKGRVHFGGSPDPHNCYMLERGMRTLHARMPILTSNSAELARRLLEHPKVVRVQHVTLPSHPDYEVAQRVVPKGCGMLGIVVAGGDEGAMEFMSKLNLFYEATSLGGVESLIEVPATSSHMAMPVDVRIAAGIEPGYVRMSIGIEDVEDLWEDLNQALS